MADALEAAASALERTAPLHGLAYLAEAYSREADRNGEADDYEAAEAYSEAAEAVAASGYDGSELAPTRGQAVWGALQKSE